MWDQLFEKEQQQDVFAGTSGSSFSLTSEYND